MITTVREAVNEFLAAMRRKPRKPETCNGYQQRLEVFCDWIDAQNTLRAQQDLELYHLGNITSRVVDDFVRHLRETHKPHRKNQVSLSTYTLAGYVRYIKVFLSWVEQDEEYAEQIRPVTIRRIKLPDRETLLIQPFQHQHIQAMITACEREQAYLIEQGVSPELAVRNECIVRLLIATGLRAAELCGLTVEHVYLEPDQGYVRVFGKRDKWREVPFIAFPMEEARKKMSRGNKVVKQMEFRNEQGAHFQSVQLDDDLRRTLKQYRNKYRVKVKPTDPFFLGRYHDALTTDALEKIIQRIVDGVEIPLQQKSPHIFRHTFAVLFMKYVQNVYLLSKLMGHSSVRTTEEYLRSLQGEEVRAAFLRQIGRL